MKIINLGSINIDHVYTLDHFVRPGETFSASSYEIFPGGKGFNQSIALAKCGVPVLHAGKIGSDGVWMKKILETNGVDTSLIVTSSQPTGHAVIQVIPSGENAIIIFGGANTDLDESFRTSVLSRLEPGDYLLLQNEVNDVGRIIDGCRERNVNIIFNPAPMTASVNDYSLHLLNALILNQPEASALTGKTGVEELSSELGKRYPQLTVVLTLGKEGVVLVHAGETIRVPAKSATPVDTTAAGDTLIGFFIGQRMKGKSIRQALETATIAAAICVTRKGAARSIPELQEVVDFQA